MSAVSTVAEVKHSLEKPVFTKVRELRPGTKDLTLSVKVVRKGTKMVMQRGGLSGSQARPTRIAEFLVGDETGMIIFMARNEQVDLMKEGNMVTLQNAKIGMFKGSMRLAVDKQGHVEVTESEDITVKEDNNLSLIEFELVHIVKKE